MRRALRAARRLGHAAVLLVGDAPYYGRFGFSTEKTGTLWLPGPYERERLLGCELVSGALDGAAGLVTAAGRLDHRRRPDMAATAREGRRRAA
jgi:predicted N-acetyltransferase YhbS